MADIDVDVDEDDAAMTGAVAVDGNCASDRANDAADENDDVDESALPSRLPPKNWEDVSP